MIAKNEANQRAPRLLDSYYYSEGTRESGNTVYRLVTSYFELVDI